MSELKACPFCGRSERDPQRQVHDHVPGPPRWCGYCPCGATGPTAENGDDAVVLWNARPEEDRLRSALQAAERERDASYEAHAATMKTLDAERAYREQERAQRDSARLEAGRLAQELVEVTGKLALAEVEVGRLRGVLEEREGDMHLRIRADYDKTVADAWRARVSKLEDELLVFKTGYEQHAGQVCCQPFAGQPAFCGIRQPIRFVNDHERWRPLVTCEGCRKALEPKEVTGG